MKKFWFAGLAIFTFLACEKDDICDGGDSETPNVIINMYNNNDSDVLKPAVKICLIAEGFQDTLVFKNTAKIEIPLEITKTETTWKLVLFEPNPTKVGDTIYKSDVLRFTYNKPESIYVSKACGYKVTFNGFNASKQANTTNDAWIQNIFTLTNEITNENNAHIQLFY